MNERMMLAHTRGRFVGGERRRDRSVLSCLAPLAIAGVTATCFAGCGKSEKSDTKAIEQPRPPVAPADRAPPNPPLPPNYGYYDLKPGASTIEWEGRKVTGAEKGQFASFTGHIEMLEPAHPNRIELSIDTASLTTPNDKLTAHLKSPDFFDVAKYPAAHFRLAESKVSADAPSSYKLTGELELHGVSKSISFPAVVTFEGGHLKAKADVVINRKDFGIVYPGKRDDLIADSVTIHLNLDAAKR